MASWILVPCLASLRDEFTRLAPERDRASDGSIGDQAHAHSSSDHNPDETGRTPSEDPDAVNEVHAIDVDADLRRAGWSMDKAVEIIVTRHRTGRDDRLQNIIWNRRIWSRSTGWTVRTYTGSNAHTQHAHFSARYLAALEADTRPWGLLEQEDDGMAGITQDEFNTRMDAWWNARMSPNAKDNPARTALRVAPWQQEVARTGTSTHDVLFSQMRNELAQVPDDVFVKIASKLDAVPAAVFAELAADGRSAETLAAILRPVLGEQAKDVGRLLAASL